MSKPTENPKVKYLMAYPELQPGQQVVVGFHQRLTGPQVWVTDGSKEAVDILREQYQSILILEEVP